MAKMSEKRNIIIIIGMSLPDSEMSAAINSFKRFHTGMLIECRPFCQITACFSVLQYYAFISQRHPLVLHHSACSICL